MCCLDSNVAQCLNIAQYPSKGGHWAILRCSMADTGLHFWGNHGFRVWNSQKKHFLYEFLAIERVRTNICWMGYKNTNLKVCLSLFGCEELILPKQHIVQCISTCDLSTSSCELDEWRFDQTFAVDPSDFDQTFLLPPTSSAKHRQTMCSLLS